MAESAGAQAAERVAVQTAEVVELPDDTEAADIEIEELTPDCNTEAADTAAERVLPEVLPAD